MIVGKVQWVPQATAESNHDNLLSSKHPKIYRALGQQKARDQGGKGDGVHPKSLAPGSYPVHGRSIICMKKTWAHTLRA